MRILQYGCLIGSKVFEDEAPVISFDLQRSHDVLQSSRRYLRLFYSLFNLRRILRYNNKDSKGFLRKMYIFSKFLAFGFYGVDSF